MMDLMKAMQDPATMQAMSAFPVMLNNMMVLLQEIRDAAILQNRLTALQLLYGTYKSEWIEAVARPYETMM